MRLFKMMGLVLCICAMIGVASAGENHLGIRDVSHVTFVAPVRVGSTLLPAGEYVVRHTMQGEDHIMVFQSSNKKTVQVKVKCTLVALKEKANETAAVYEMNAANERVLQELVFAGDTAKHVFQP